MNLRSTLDDLDRLVAVSKPATRELAPFLRTAAPGGPRGPPDRGRPAHPDPQPGTNNDLIELTAKQPRLAELTSSVFPRAIRTLDRAQPVFEYVRSYTPDFASWLSNFGQLAANYDANGHYARVQPMFLPSTFCAGRTRSARRDRRRRSWTASSGASSTAAPARSCSPPPTARARSRWGCDPATTPPGP